MAVGRSHAALLTRRGQLYTWGSGAGGRLGHGGAASSARPLRLLTLWEAVATSVKCSDTATAAVTQVAPRAVQNPLPPRPMHAVGPLTLTAGKACLLKSPCR